MARVHRFKILRESGFNDIEYFDATTIYPEFKKFKVELLIIPGKLENGNDSKLYGVVYDKNNTLLGHFDRKMRTIFMVFTFYATYTGYTKEFYEFIRSTKEDLEFDGYHIVESQSFNVEIINPDIEGNQNEPRDARNEGRYENTEEGPISSSSDAVTANTGEDLLPQENPLWEQIDEDEKYKKMVRLMHEGYSASQIADEMSYLVKTIYNWSSKLRKKYDASIVPYFRKWQNPEN